MSGREDDIRTPPPPLSQDTPPQPWTPPAPAPVPASARPEQASRYGLTVEVNPAGPDPVPVGPQAAPPWAKSRYSNSRRRGYGSPLLGPIFLIAAGVVFLLNNTGVLPWAIWGELWRLWPLVLVAIGLDMLFGRRNSFLSLVIVLGVLAAGGAYIFYYTGALNPGNIVQAQLNVPMAGTAASPAEAAVTIKPGTGDLRVDGQAGDQLASGTLEYYDRRVQPDRSVNVRGGLIELNLEARDNSSFQWIGFDNRNPSWNIHLTKQVPINLKVDTGTGDSALDLRDVKLAGLQINIGTGDVTVQLPAPYLSNTTAIALDGSTGDFNITLPQAAEASIKVDTATGDLSIPPRFTKKEEGLYLSPGYATASKKLDISIKPGTGDVEIK